MSDQVKAIEGRCARPCRRRWRGSVYLPILLISSVAATLAVGGLLMVQSHTRSLQLRGEAAVARANALSAIEVARARIEADVLWRSRNSNGTWISDQPVSAADPRLGTYSVSVVNPMGALNRSDADQVIITGTGKLGGATQVVSVGFAPGDKKPMPCLSAGIAAAGNVYHDKLRVAGTATELLLTNGDVINSGDPSVVKLIVQAAGVISGSDYKAATTTGAEPTTFPDSSTLFTLYDGTPINFATLPLYSGYRYLGGGVLSPASNPYGTTDPRGIYVVDCGGQPLGIGVMRIVGTLVVLNCPKVIVTERVMWTSAEPNLPALLVQGNLQIAITGSALGETTYGINFNPAGTPYPYPGGAADTDATDNYTTGIDGLVYASGNITIQQTAVLHTVIAGGTILLDKPFLTLTRDTRYSSAPPPGFFTTRSTLLRGTFR